MDQESTSQGTSQQELLGTNAVAKILGCSDSSVRDLIYTKELKARRALGNHGPYIITRNDLEDYQLRTRVELEQTGIAPVQIPAALQPQPTSVNIQVDRNADMKPEDVAHVAATVAKNIASMNGEREPARYPRLGFTDLELHQIQDFAIQSMGTHSQIKRDRYYIRLKAYYAVMRFLKLPMPLEDWAKGKLEPFDWHGYTTEVHVHKDWLALSFDEFRSPIGILVNPDTLGLPDPFVATQPNHAFRSVRIRGWVRRDDFVRYANPGDPERFRNPRTMTMNWQQRPFQGITTLPR